MTTLSHRANHWNRRTLQRGLVLAVTACLVLGGTLVLAQSKKSAKEAENLSKAADNAKKSVGDVVDHLGKMLEGYNSIINGTAKNPQSAYKKLVGDLKSTEKMIQGAGKSLDAVNKDAQKYFAAWETDLESFTNEELKQKSQDRLNMSKEKYATLGEALGQASDAFVPLVQNLNDQILFLGRDLSPEAIADLQDEAEALNQQAQEVTDQVKALMESASEGEPAPAT